MKKRYVSASELGDYVYCMWCWWRHFQGEEKVITAAMNDGAHKHNLLFGLVILFERLKKNMVLFFVVGTVLLLLAVVLRFFFHI